MAPRHKDDNRKDPSCPSLETPQDSPRAISLKQTSSKSCVYQRQAWHVSHVRELIQCQEQSRGGEAVVIVRLLGRARGDTAYHLLTNPVLDGLLDNLLPSRNISVYYMC